MGTVHTFRSRGQLAVSTDVRATIEAAAQAALDQADHLISILDRLDGDTDQEDGSDAEPSS